MKRKLLGFLGAALVATLAVGCKKDPTASLAGGVARITTSLSFVTVAAGDSVLVSVVARDQAGDPVPATATGASDDASVADVTPVSATPLNQTNFYLKGVAAGTTAIRFTAASASDSVAVVVN